MHKIRVFIPEVIYGARNGLLMALFIPGGASRNDLYGEAPRERGTFFRLQGRVVRRWVKITQGYCKI